MDTEIHTLIKQGVSEFKADLDDETKTEKAIVDKYLVHGNPIVFKNNERVYYSLREKVSTKFDIEARDVVMIGSAKLGFSLAPQKLWNEFNEESDIDIAIVNQEIFEKYWRELLDFNISLTYRTELEDKNYRKFMDYFLKGWIRPDLFPFKYDGKSEWFEFFKSISYKEFGNFKINGAIYKDIYFFNYYHTSNIKNIRDGK